MCDIGKKCATALSMGMYTLLKLKDVYGQNISVGGWGLQKE